MRGVLLGVWLLLSGACAAGEPAPIELVPQIGHSGMGTWQATYSADGRKILTTGTNEVKLWDTPTGCLIRTFEIEGVELRHATLSPEQDYVAAATRADTVVVWDARSGQRIRTFAMHGPAAVAFRDNGAILIVVNADAVQLWDIATGQPRKSYPVPATGSVQISADTTKIVWFDASEFVVLDINTGIIKRTHSAELRSTFALSPDGLRLATWDWSGEGKIALWDTVQGVKIRDIGAGPRWGGWAFSHDGSVFYARDPDTSLLNRWNGRTGELLDSLSIKDVSEIYDISPDGSSMLAAKWSRSLSLFSLNDGIERLQLPAYTVPIRDVKYSADGKRFAVKVSNSGPSSLADRRLQIWDAATGALLENFKDNDEAVWLHALNPEPKQRDVPPNSDAGAEPISGQPTGVASTAPEVATRALVDRSMTSGELLGAVEFLGGRRVLAVVSDKKSSVLRIWDVESRKLIYESRNRICEQSYFDYCGRLVRSPDGNRALWQRDRGIDLIDLASGDAPHTIIALRDESVPRNGGPILNIRGAFSRSGVRFLVIYGGSVEIHASDTGALIKTLRGQMRKNITADFSPDGKHVITGSSDGAARLWNADNGMEIARFITSWDGEWLAMTVGRPGDSSQSAPTGIFNASPGGSQLLSIVRGLEAHTADQVFEQLYRPQLVAEALKDDSLGLYRSEAKALNLTAILDSGDPPEVRLLDQKTKVSADGSEINLKLQIVNTGHGIGKRLVVSLDGHPQGNDFRAELVNARDASDVVVPVTLSVTDPSVNHDVKVVAYNGEGLLASRPVHFTVGKFGAAPPDKLPARMYVLAVGINDYPMSGWHLNYASSDARHFVEAMNQVAPGQFSEIKVWLLNNEKGKPVVTAAAIREAFEEIASDRDLRPNDLFVLFVAGHGTFDGERYRFIPQDFDIARGDTIDNKAIDNEALEGLIKSVKVDKRVIILDTCASGNAALGRGTNNPLQVASYVLSTATGDGVLAASSEIAHEHQKLGYGLLTYGILRAFVPSSPADRETTVSFGSMADHAIQEVVNTSLDIYAEAQKPKEHVAGGGQGIPLGFKRLNLPGAIQTMPGDYFLDAAVAAHAPDPDSAVVAQLPKAKRVKLIAYDAAHKWAKILWDESHVGWVRADSLFKLID
jgi:WD40 repeat protein